MHRIDHATRKVDANGPGKDGFTEGTPGVEPATVVTADWANAVQEEIARAIEARGLALSKPDNAQLAAALATPLTTLEGQVAEISTRLNALEAIDADNRLDALEGHVRPDLVERTLFIGPQGTSDWDATDGRPEWEPHSTTGGARDAMKSRMPGDGDRARISWDLYPGNELPTHCTVTRVRAWVTPGAAYTVGNTMVLSVYRITGGTPALAGGGTSTTGLTTFHAISTGTISIELVAANIDVYPPGANLGLSVVLTGGNGANDLVHFLEVRYTLAGI